MSQRSPTQNRPGKPAAWGICAGLAILTLAVFAPTFGYGFVNYDDNDYVFDNPAVSQGLTRDSVVWAFTKTHSSNWHPLTWLSHCLDCQLYGLRAGGHHLTSVLLHTATVVLLFLVLRRLTGAPWKSALAAAVFAIHPLRVESVAWISERKDVLSGLFFVLTIAAYAGWVRGGKSVARYALVMLLFVLGLMSKPMLVTLPAVLLLLDFWPLRRTEPWRRLLLEKVPLLALSAISCFATLRAQTEAIRLQGTFPLACRLGNALVSYAIYLRQMVWPVNLAVFYPLPRHAPPAWQMTVSGGLLIALSVLAWTQRKKRPWLLCGWLWYVVMLLPVIGIVQAGLQSHADRYTYLPQIGIYLACIWMLAEWGETFRVQPALAGSMAVIGLLLLTWRSRAQVAYWKDSETLWRHAIACATDNDVVHDNLGNVLQSEGRLDEAMAQYQRALAIQTKSPEVRNNIGNLLHEQGKTAEAMAQYQIALALQPNLPDTLNNIGNLLGESGRWDKAIESYKRALQIRPGFTQAHHNLATALLKQGRFDEAIAEFQRAVECSPLSFKARADLGDALEDRGRMDEAIVQYKAALTLKPDYPEAHNDLAIALRQQGKAEEAIGEFELALQYDPNYAEARNNLGIIFLDKGRLDEAIAQFREALRLAPGNAGAHINLGIALQKKGRIDEAIAEYRKGLGIQPDQLDALSALAEALSQSGQTQAAIETAQRALGVAHARHRQDLEAQFARRIKQYQQLKPARK